MLAIRAVNYVNRCSRDEKGKKLRRVKVIMIIKARRSFASSKNGIQTLNYEFVWLQS